MPGIGKTTLARKVFNNQNVECHFHRRAWCTVSQAYSKRELLLELISHIDVRTDDINKLTDDDLMSKLRRCLLRNKYLIAMDDVWDTSAWNDLENCFPDDSNGNRILITSRYQDVASKVKPGSTTHFIRPFSDDESWELLRNKIFKGGDCPTELLEVGIEISQRCRGLPLAVVTIAGLLRMLEKNKVAWTKVLKSLSSEIISDAENPCKGIFELSYDNLPEYLKACFIYLGLFLEDKDIPVSKLIRFWMAEGFIPETKSKSLEEVAEDYLMELINRSLVTIYRKRSNGKVKTCRLHDLLRDMCRLKAKDENFEQFVTRCDEPYASFPDLEYDMELDSKNLLAPILLESYRLSFYVKRRHFINSRPSSQVARSLTFFASSDSEPKCPYDISFICHNFKLLRFLDLESIMAMSFPAEIGLMVQLRYLAVSGYMQSVPPSISNLWKLETFLVKGSQGKVILPETIWNMKRLRHLHVNHHVLFNLQGLDGDVGSSYLENLVSFSTPSLSCREDRWRILKRLPNLRKLRCIFWNSAEPSEKCSEFIRWNFLTHLESLKIICHGGAPHSRDFLLPQSLKKLTLSNFRLQENHLTVMGKLPNLRVLKLRAGAFEGQKWETREEEFEGLEFLELDTMNLVEWDASYDHFPRLEWLVIRNCKGLKAIPSDFAYIAALEKLEVHWCGQSVEDCTDDSDAGRPEPNCTLCYNGNVEYHQCFTVFSGSFTIEVVQKFIAYITFMKTLSWHCPEELWEVGIKIVQGLPLSVVMIAGLLKMLEQNKDTCSKVLKSLSSEIPENRDLGMPVMTSTNQITSSVIESFDSGWSFKLVRKTEKAIGVILLIHGSMSHTCYTDHLKSLEKSLSELKSYIDDEKEKSEGRKEHDDYCRWLDTLAEKINQLGQDWFFLQMLCSLLFCSYNAEEIMKVNRYDLWNICVGVADEILGHFDSCDDDIREKKFNPERSQKVLSLFSESQRKTDELIETKFRGVMKDLQVSAIRIGWWEELGSASSVLLPHIEVNLCFFNDLGSGSVVEENMVFLFSELKSICKYLTSVADTYIQVVNKRLFDVESVVLRIVCHSCNLWFNRKDHPETAKVSGTKIFNLLLEIVPTNLEFLNSILAPLEYKRGLSFFFDYLLAESDADLGSVIKSLVTFYIGNSRELLSEGEDEMPNIRRELLSVLAEAAGFSHPIMQRDFEKRGSSFLTHAFRKSPSPRALPSCSELQAKSCLLKAELCLKQQLHTSASMLFPDPHPISKFGTILDELRAFTKDFGENEKTDFVRQSLELAEELANEVESLHKSLLSKEKSDSLVKHPLLVCLFRILYFKADSFLADLLKSSDSSIAHQREQIHSLVEGLTYFKGLVQTRLESYPSGGDKTVITKIEGVARRITLLSYSYLTVDQEFEEIVRSLDQLLYEVNNIKAELTCIREPLAKFGFPKNFRSGFWDFLCRNIRELLIHDPESIRPVKHHIEEVLLHLDSLKSVLPKIKDMDFELGGESKDFGNHILNITYKLEYVVDSIEVDGHVQLQQSLWLQDLLNNIKLVNQQVRGKISEMSSANGNVEKFPKSSSWIAPRGNTPELNEILVDLVDEEKAIVDRLTRGSSQRDVVSIVGMPGIGKSTLARKVFNNPNVMCDFDRRAWCYVSQSYSKRELLLELLSHNDGLTKDISRLTDDDLLSELRRYLLKSKYLIVMDDIWDSAPWNDLEYILPDDGNGSRILITSRHQDVAINIKSDRKPHCLRPFSDDESWKLLKNKTFKGADCPDELLELGREIARQCQGLPLAVVTIACLLQKLENNKDSWIEISKSLSSEIIRDPENRCKEILEMSYRHLPEYLKACFIYLGVFLKDKDIPVSKLIRFWIAEGFIQGPWKSLEEVAEDYLTELIDRSLVNIHKTRSNGQVKTCRLHDLLRDLCHLKAKDENFQHFVSRNDAPYASFPDTEYDMEFDGKDLSSPVRLESYRVSFNVKRRHFINSRPSGLVTRSLTFFPSSDSEPKCPYDISFICHNFKLLRVLDLESIMAISFPLEIGLMVQLRYLAVSGYMQSIPPSISKLWKLETFVVKGLQGKVILPETIWIITRLRHLHVNSHVLINLQSPDEVVSSYSQLENLVSFSTPSLSCRDNRWQILKRLPNLRKLRCIFWQSGDSEESCHEFIRWNFLTLLETLKIICLGGTPNYADFLLPQCLKKLTLSNFCLQEIHLNVIGKLPNLRVLKLCASAFEGQKWEMQEEEFMELKFLELDSMSLVKWEASYDHLPSLEQLVLRNCKDLERIPFDFSGIVTLQKVEVHWCRQSVEESAKDIGNETPEIKVTIIR
ncbi:OLC1v1019177C1 [Oldenlandia corymbosa var. corymbosa]|uniref:OLC1v1019177C1 n=1 Tax=Oldenlandia corymbosa var. corymbosa TaxID=529605 RepID=A0AAV1EDR9_OLDCO|nr:OLC1v1019177C1 [Oldenlandia corymbosa var. corymbosa]